MQYLILTILLCCIQFGGALRCPGRLGTEATRSPMYYGCRRSLGRYETMLALLRFSTSTFYRIGAMMGVAERVLGVNVVE